MKKILILSLCLALCLAMRAQTAENYHFSLRDGYVTWQMVYESPIDSTSAINYLLGSGNFADFVEVSNGTSFSILPRRIDARADGLTTGSVAIYISSYPMIAHGLLEIKPGRYRVTVNRIVFFSDPDTPIEAYALNKRLEFKQVFVTMNAARALDSEFTRLFTIKKAEEEEDW